MSAVSSRRVLLTKPPFVAAGKKPEWNHRGEWPCKWISCDEDHQLPVVAAYKLLWELDQPKKIVVHVTADERYRLFLNGSEIGRGSERGDLDHWYFESYEVDVPAGPNVWVAQVWTLGPDSAYAQFSQHHGFLLCPDDESLVATIATGVAPWKAKKLPGYRFQNPQTAWGTGFNLLLDGNAFDWDFEEGGGEGWKAAHPLTTAITSDGSNDKPPQHQLLPATLPAMAHTHWTKARVRHVSFPAPGSTAEVPFRPEDSLEEEVIDWTRLVIGNPLTIPPYSRRRVLLDLHDYVCAYPELTVSKGRQSQVRIHWQESLFQEFGKTDKGNRDEIDNKYFCTIWSWQEGVGDTFLPNGSPQRKFTTLWWQAGRYVEILIQTELQELVIESLQFREDRYPFENELTFQCNDPALEEVGRLAYRTLQMCAHETYMDCPYYEQLQYIGDTRLQALVTYVTSHDDRLPRKALQAFDWSRRVEGITQSRYPSRVIQTIPPFSLWWICMIWDYARWRGDRSFVESLVPGARMVLDWFHRFRNGEGLIESPEGWNYVDWVPEWDGGMPIGASDGVSGPINRQYEIALRRMAEIEQWLGEPEFADRNLRIASEVAHAIHTSFWNNKRTMYADDLGHTSFSEHSQVLSILTDVLPEKIFWMVSQGLLTDPDLHRTTVYFSHYLFEAYARVGRTDQILARMSLWTDQVARGLKTIVEMPEPTRSDCHAWGAHPLYHYVTSLLGVQPKGLGGRDLEIRPNLGGLRNVEAAFPFAGGQVSIKAKENSEGMDFEIDLPEATTATLLRPHASAHLLPGHHEFHLK